VQKAIKARGEVSDGLEILNGGAVESCELRNHRASCWECIGKVLCDLSDDDILTPNAMLNATQVSNVIGLLWFRCRRECEELRLHIDFAETSNAARQLEQCLYAFENAHMRKANLLIPCQYMSLLVLSIMLP
jgi:hypothetical protein